MVYVGKSPNVSLVFCFKVMGATPPSVEEESLIPDLRLHSTSLPLYPSVFSHVCHDSSVVIIQRPSGYGMGDIYRRIALGLVLKRF